MPTLTQKSEARVKASEEFKPIFAAIEKARKEKDNTEVSLKALEKPLAETAAVSTATQKVASAGNAPLQGTAINGKKDSTKANTPHSKGKSDVIDVFLRINRRQPASQRWHGVDDRA